jgi:hypothetical protein
MTELRLKLPAGKDGNFIHGFGYPRISGPTGMDMEGLLCPWISCGGYPITHGVGMGRGFAPWISNRYPADMWVPHVSETRDFTYLGLAAPLLRPK